MFGISRCPCLDRYLESEAGHAAQRVLIHGTPERDIAGQQT
jgi:hypothetical protein